MKTIKKTPADYGLFCFRLSKNERDEINHLLDEVKTRLNKNKKKEDFVITKNEIIFKAIKLGLPLVKKNKG